MAILGRMPRGDEGCGRERPGQIFPDSPRRSQPSQQGEPASLWALPAGKSSQNFLEGRFPLPCVPHGQLKGEIFQPEPPGYGTLGMPASPPPSQLLMPVRNRIPTTGKGTRPGPPACPQTMWFMARSPFIKARGLIWSGNGSTCPDPMPAQSGEGGWLAREGDCRSLSGKETQAHLHQHCRFIPASVWGQPRLKRLV